MSKIYINSSGESYATINGELVHDVDIQLNQMVIQ